MISEVLLYRLMITCILIRVSSTEVKWTVRDTSPTLGQSLTLFCKVVNCTVDGTKRWRGGPGDKVLMLKNGISTDKAKYSTSIEKNGFILTILNLTVEYLNVSYDCSCGLYNDKHILYVEDVYTDIITDPNTEEQSTISTSEKEDLSTVDNLNKTTNGTNDVLWVILYVAIGIAIILAIIVIVIKRRWLWERLKEKDNCTQRKNSDSSLQSVPVDSDQRQSLDADDNQNVTDPLFQTTDVDSNVRQSSDLDDNLDGNELLQQPQESINRITGSSSPSIHIGINQRLHSDEVDGPNVTDPLLQTTPVDSNPGQSSDSDDNLHGNELLQQPQESINRFTDDSLHGNELVQHPLESISRVTAAESLEPSTSTSTSSLQDSINHRDDPASTLPVKKRGRKEYKKIELREKSFKTWPLNVPTIEQLAEAGFFHSGHKNIAQCFSCGYSIHWKEGQDPLDEEWHINCTYLRQITNNTQLKQHVVQISN